MKHVITTSVVAGLLGALGYGPVASAEGTLYGSVRSGIIVQDDGDSDAMWDLGSVDGGDRGDRGDRLWSRIGVKASHELDNGMTAGLHIEKRLDQLRTRHQNVWLSGEMGRITLGQQGSPYHSAVGRDGANVSFASNLVGPFNFKTLLVDDASYGKGYGDGVDGFEVSGGIAAGGMNINVGYADNDAATFMGATVGGSLQGLGWEVGFETKNPDASGADDTNLAGVFVDYSPTSKRNGMGVAHLEPDGPCCPRPCCWRWCPPRPCPAPTPYGYAPNSVMGEAAGGRFAEPSWHPLPTPPLPFS